MVGMGKGKRGAKIFKEVEGGKVAEVASFRLSDGMERNKYWEREKIRMCRVCGWREETWKHVWEKCTSWGREKGWQNIQVQKILGKEGEEGLDEEIK